MKLLQEVGFSGEGEVSGWRTSVTSAALWMGLLLFPFSLQLARLGRKMLRVGSDLSL